VILDGIVQGGESTIDITFAKDFDNWDGVIPSLQVRVHIVLQSELFPSSPMLVHGIGLLAGNARSDALVNNAKISTECIPFECGQRRQGQV
jgi:hypothetical protein